MNVFIAVVFYCSASLGGCEFWGDEKTLHPTQRECAVVLNKLGAVVKREYPDAQMYGTCMPMSLVSA